MAMFEEAQVKHWGCSAVRGFHSADLVDPEQKQIAEQKDEKNRASKNC